MYYHQTNNGIRYTENIVSINGAAYMLYPDATHTQADIEKAKIEIRHKHDVVSIRVAGPDDLDYAFKSKIFSDARTKTLKFYEINDDEALIRRERLKGTSAADYVTNYVLPYIEETKKRNIEKYGADVINSL